MSYLEELLPEFRKGAKIRRRIWDNKELFVKINEAGEPVLNNGNKFEFCRNIICSDWEFYQEPEPDWQYIIDHRCLCAFGNKKGCEFLGFLKQRMYHKDTDFYTYTSLPGAIYVNCRPVRKDEVTFYEDKRDGNN